MRQHPNAGKWFLAAIGFIFFMAITGFFADLTATGAMIGLCMGVLIVAFLLFLVFLGHISDTKDNNEKK